MRNFRSARFATLIVLAASLSAPSAQAQNSGEQPFRLDYRLGLAIEHSDNVRRTATDTESANVLLPSLGFVLAGQGDRFRLEAAGEAEFRSYRDGSFDSELRTRLGLRGVWTMLPERLSWSFEDYLGRQPIDAFAVDRPDNQQRTHVLSTGPTLSLRPDARTRVLAELRWIDAWAQRTREFNNQRWNLALRGIRQLSQTQSLSGHLEYTDTRFEQTSASVQPFERVDGFLRWDRRAARIEFSGDFGASRIEFEDAQRRNSGLLRLRLGWLPNEAHRVEIRAARQYSDALADLAGAAPQVADFELPVGLPSLRSTFLNPDVFRENSLGLAHQRNGRRLYSRLDAYWRDQDYARSDALDQEVRGLSLGVSRPLRETLALNAFASFDQREYTLTAREDRESLYGLSLRWRWWRRMDVEFGASRAHRRSPIAAERYDETRYFLGLVYRRR